MAEGSRVAKRRRTSTSPNTIAIVDSGKSVKPTKGQETFARDVDFWLEDGNLILLAGTIALRVYRGILVKKSIVFADMFDTGSLDATEMFDGCPVVRLSDHPEDLKDFLQYLMSCSDVELLRGVPVPESAFSQLHAALHLAHKYQCPDVETRVLFSLKKYYTANFTEYDMYHGDALKFALRHPTPQAAIAAVNIARLTQTPSMLPYALYLASNREGQMLDGYKRRDGTVEYLSAEDLRLCIDARGELAREMASLIKDVFTLTPSPGCKSVKACMAARADILESVELNAPGEISVLQPYTECIEERADLHGLCEVCQKGMLAREVEERRRVWKRLPQIFKPTAEDRGTPSDGSSDTQFRTLC